VTKTNQYKHMFTKSKLTVFRNYKFSTLIQHDVYFCQPRI